MFEYTFWYMYIHDILDIYSRQAIRSPRSFVDLTLLPHNQSSHRPESIQQARSGEE